MTLSNIKRLFNNALAGDNIPLKEQLPHLDSAIDNINTRLNTQYPAFSDIDWTDETLDYDCFDDKYIRSVVIPFAAWHYYVTDEEGLQTAPQYQASAEQGLFYMMRDTLYDIPQMYQADLCQGGVDANPTNWQLGYRGIDILNGGI